MGEIVSNLFVIGYPDVPAAAAARDKILSLQKEHLIELDDIVVVENKDGKIKLHQSANLAGLGAASGALWGGLIGLIFFMPLLGMAVGAAAGAAGGALTDVGVDDKMMKDLANTLSPGSAAVFALVRQSTQDKVIAELAPYGGKLLQSSLSAEAEEHLRQALAAAKDAGGKAANGSKPTNGSKPSNGAKASNGSKAPSEAKATAAAS